MKQPTMKQPQVGMGVDERSPIRERWTEQPMGASDEAVAGALLRSAAVVRPFSPKELAEVGARLRSKERFRPRPLGLQVAIAVSLILFGGVLSAAVLRVLRAPARVPTQEPGAPPTSKPVRHALPGKGRPPAPPSPLETTETPAPASASELVLTLPPSGPVPTHVHRTLASRETPKSASPVQPSALAPAPQLDPVPVATASALAKESRLLAQAIGKLRQEGNAVAALSILDNHRAEFGSSGALAPEANATRIEALLYLGRHAQALALLDAQALNSTGTAREMLVARAELRADKGRHTAALHDFDLLLQADGPADSVTERALYGRAVCRTKLGKWDGARVDFERYLALFPDGKFANKTRAAIKQ